MLQFFLYDVVVGGGGGGAIYTKQMLLSVKYDRYKIALLGEASVLGH